MGYLRQRREETIQRLNLVREILRDSEQILGNKACIYATGSFGRLEAGQNSDLDLFILSKTYERSVSGKLITISQLSQLDTILLKADLIKAVRELQMPDFDSDGRYLAAHSVFDLVQSLGAHDDDYKNTLTGRLLLFLESQPLVGRDVYEEVIDDVINAYFGDYEDHASEFIPAFLANDILRLWRTFCVNYEFGRRGKLTEGKIKNYKLKHSRMLTCYSALLYLLAVFQLENTVTKLNAKNMALLTPIARLEWILQQQVFSEAHDNIKKLIQKYSDFLLRTNLPNPQLNAEFEAKNAEWMTGSYAFGDMMYTALNEIGRNTRFYRLIVV